VSAALVEQAFAKINLTLRVLGRRGDGYHELESLVAFADIADTLALQPASETALDIGGPFAAASGPVADNLVLKAAHLLGAGFRADADYVAEVNFLAHSEIFDIHRRELAIGDG
jgi:4-diphosphocytidyl-2C-methyl-D-erythritol kinase